MFFDNEIADLFARGLLLATIGLVWIVMLVRMVGLRSFSKMTSVDFVMTVAMGSLLAGATQSESWESYVQTLLAMLALFMIQMVFAQLRRQSERVDEFVQNQPILLMRDGRIIESALRESRVSRNELIAKLRQANILEMSQVRAAILETTGDVSILHGDHLKEELLKGGQLDSPYKNLI